MGSSNIQNYYLWPSTVNVANFISTKLWFKDTSTNYEIWKEQMLCLIEGHGLLGFIDGSILPPQPETQQENYLLWRRSDRLLKGWILGSLHENVISQVAALTTASDVWLELENKFSQLKNASALIPTDLMEYVPLHKAALLGDWEAAKGIFDRDPGVVLNSRNMSPLHVAVGTGKNIHFVQKMVDLMSDDAIAKRVNTNGYTALHVAAAVGNIGAATILVNRMPALLYLSNFNTVAPEFPLQTAAIFAQKRMVEYLIPVTNEQTPYNGMSGLTLLRSLIVADFFDIALDLVNRYPYLAKLRSPNGSSALAVIAENKTVFQSGCRFGFWERFIPIRRTKLEKHVMMNQQAQSLVKCLCKQLEFMSSREASVISHNAIIIAAQVGNSDLVEMVVEAYPSAIYYRMLGSGQTIFHMAVENRSEHVFNLVYQMTDHKNLVLDILDNYGNTILHAAGKLGPSHKLNQISGAALQMQRELQWFKEVEKFAHPNSKKRLNKDGKTPQMVFTEEHKQLKEEGEKWMKDTSASCSIAAALIVTIMFAAAITIPGDYDDTTGFPMFSKDVEFIVFGISNAISLFTSTTSLLMLLSILTSRYAEEDFLHALPKRLIIGLGMLFQSVTFMMVAFSVTIYLVFGRKKAWVLIPVAALACLPVTSFVLLQYPLLADLISSTYGRGIFGKRSNHPLY